MVMGNPSMHTHQVLFKSAQFLTFHVEKLWRVGSSINNQRSIHIFITIVPKGVMVKDVTG